MEYKKKMPAVFSKASKYGNFKRARYRKRPTIVAWDDEELPQRRQKKNHQRQESENANSTNTRGYCRLEMKRREYARRYYADNEMRACQRQKREARVRKKSILCVRTAMALEASLDKIHRLMERSRAI
jgi:hypothetical protein